jgi:RNA polymerase sigma factor (sigma-70 family)
MSTRTEGSLQTRETLLERLRQLDDQESWRIFFERYWRLIYNIGLRAGLDDASAQDIVQETVIAVARKMPGFQYDPERGSFKQWLLRLTQRRIADYWRKVYRQPPRADIMPEQLDEDETYAQAASSDPAGQIEAVWEEEWQRSIFDAAVACVRREADPKQFQVFDYCVLQGWPVSKVSATLGMNPARVYLARHRVGQAVKRTVRRITWERNREGCL